GAECARRSRQRSGFASEGSLRQAPRTHRNPFNFHQSAGSRPRSELPGAAATVEHGDLACRRTEPAGGRSERGTAPRLTWRQVSNLPGRHRQVRPQGRGRQGMAIYTTFFLCKPEELPGGFPGWRLPLAKPVRREFRNPFTGELSVVETHDPDWPRDSPEVQRRAYQGVKN